MNQTKPLSDSLDFRAVIDGLGQGVLIFDSEDRLVLDNVAARTILGANLVSVRAEGWKAAAFLLDSMRGERVTADEIRAKALRQAEPVRFHTFLAGAYTPCWATAVYGPAGATFTMITLERPDWSALTELMVKFRDEATESISSTRGHADLIKQMATRRTAKTTLESLSTQVVGFANIIGIHMYRLELLIKLLQRLEVIRTGQLPAVLRTNRRVIPLAGFLEDLLEDVVQNPLVESPDPRIDYRERIKTEVSDDVKVLGSKSHLTDIFRDLLRNSLMYSEAGTPIKIRASMAPKTRSVQLDVVDQGYGIREKETGRIFAPFLRSRQPQVIAEFGYGLSLYLAKTEIEAMGGRMWFTSEEGVGSTFSFKLLLARDES